MEESEFKRSFIWQSFIDDFPKDFRNQFIPDYYPPYFVRCPKCNIPCDMTYIGKVGSISGLFNSMNWKRFVSPSLTILYDCGKSILQYDSCNSVSPYDSGKITYWYYFCGISDSTIYDLIDRKLSFYIDGSLKEVQINLNFADYEKCLEKVEAVIYYS